MTQQTSSPVGLHGHEISLLLGWHRSRELECVKAKHYRTADYHLRRAAELEALSAPPVLDQPAPSLPLHAEAEDGNEPE